MKAEATAQIVRKSYSLEIPLERFIILDRGYEHHEKLSSQMEELGAFNIDWNGHFGNFVYFTVYSEDECAVEKITQLINDYVNDFDLTMEKE